MNVFRSAVAMCLLVSVSMAEDRQSAAQLCPNSTVIYAEVPNPPELISTIFDHPLRERIEALEPYRQAIQSQPYRNFLTGRKFVEIQLDMEWRQALETLTAKGIYLGIDAKTQGVALLVRGRDADSMELLRSKLLQLLTLGRDSDAVRQGDYRGISAYELNETKLAVAEDWLVVTNKSDLGKSVLDRILDGDGESLNDDEQFQAARLGRGENLTAWAFANLAAVRNAGVAGKLFAGDAENPGGELLVGGIMSALQQTPFATAELTANHAGLNLSAGMPYRNDWIPEEREYYFGPNGSGRAPNLPEAKDTLFTLSTYRDVSEMWLRAGDLFNEQIIDGFAEADANLTTLFAGKDFGEDILGSLTPEIGFIATKQDFGNTLPRPAIRLPSFALVLGLKEPESMSRELRRTFQSMVGFFNVIGAMEGRPQLEMEMDRLDNGAELITSTYVPEPDDAQSTQAAIIFNFSPSVGFAGERFVVSSSASLARELTSAPAPRVPLRAENTAVGLQADILKSVLNENREQLISQNMLEEGHSRDEAEAAINLLLEFVGVFEDASLKLSTTSDRLAVDLGVRLKDSTGAAR
ncbi:MAG: hypothetical protein R3C19_10060 [Planctomycetaceae bacterium]